MTASLDHKKRVLAHQEAQAATNSIRRALQINAAFLARIADEFNIPESTRATIRDSNGEVIAMVTLGQALDIANEVLEPEGERV